MSGTLFSDSENQAQDREWDKEFLPDIAAALKQARQAIQAAWDCCPDCGQGLADAFAAVARARPAKEG